MYDMEKNIHKVVLTDLERVQISLVWEFEFVIDVINLFSCKIRTKNY
jgi:hypothetical protein